MTTAELMYKPFRRHPALFKGNFSKEWLHRDFAQISKAFENAKNVKDYRDLIPEGLLRKETDGVYSFNAFGDAFLGMFNEEIDNFYEVSTRENIPVRRPNSMNNYGVIVNEIGMRPLITSFQQQYLVPLSRHLFPVHASRFDGHHSFIVRYRAGEDLGLDMHTDDSDVTFNVCLGEEFAGATLSFCGMFGAPDHRRHVHTYHHEVGRAVLHLGSRRHGADDITSGRRSNLIVWNHNYAYRSKGVNSWDRDAHYEREGGRPSPVCLSHTHDRDYEAYKELPEAAKERHRRPWCPPPGYEYEGYPDGDGS
ncbi:hypothetical protein ACHAWF_006932 [Thalassiosira exigua]